MCSDRHAPSKPADKGSMSADSAISVSNLSKAYQVYSTPWKILGEALTGRPMHQKVWALTDVSFEIAKGQIVGIIGRNGAGKSTLLKILAGTLNATSGSAKVSGKISAILELGTGFNPEYSGRENIIVGGLCLGMPLDEIKSKMDSIIDFSELRPVIERPFKTYSSGMQGRLTFATAMSLNPEVLIVDEALATGDALFQEKCYHRMREICRSGATVLLVTHSLNIIYEICNSCILLRAGKVLDFGEPRQVGESYERLLAAERQPDIRVNGLRPKSPDSCGGRKTTAINKPVAPPQPPIRDDPEGSRREGGLPENQPHEGSPDIHMNEAETAVAVSARVETVDVLNETGVSVRTLILGKPYKVRLGVGLYDDLASINVGFQLQRDTGLVVIGDTTFENDKRIGGVRGDRFLVDFEFVCRLAVGTYILGVGVTEMHDATRFSLIDLQRGVMVLSVEGKRLNGLVDPVSQVTVHPCPPSA